MSKIWAMSCRGLTHFLVVIFSISHFNVKVYFICYAMSIHNSPVQQCVRIKAGFYFEKSSYLVLAGHLLTVDSRTNHVTRMQKVYDALFFTHEITAAIGLPYFDEFYLYSKHIEDGYIAFGVRTDLETISFRVIESAFDDYADYKGIEAGVGIGQSVFYFAGCYYAVIDADEPHDVITKMESNTKLNLPCHIDAALYSSYLARPLAIKGDRVWIYDNEKKRFSDSISLHDVIRGLEGFNLCEV